MSFSPPSGAQVRVVSVDPRNAPLGSIWYNSTSNQLKVQTALGPSAFVSNLPAGPYIENFGSVGSGAAYSNGSISITSFVHSANSLVLIGFIGNTGGAVVTPTSVTVGGVAATQEEQDPQSGLTLLRIVRLAAATEAVTANFTGTCSCAMIVLSVVNWVTGDAYYGTGGAHANTQADAGAYLTTITVGSGTNGRLTIVWGGQFAYSNATPLLVPSLPVGIVQIAGVVTTVNNPYTQLTVAQYNDAGAGATYGTTATIYGVQGNPQYTATNALQVGP
jgi:hypothetical protein